MGVEAGTKLGPYEIVAPLGAGGMGEVYEARDPRLDRRVALKVLRSDVASDPDRLARFEREGKAVAALNHPNILTVHDVGVHEGTPYVVTELLEGESLREVVSHRTPTQRQVLGWGVQTAQGLSAAHQKGIVHRDLKPENLFLTTDGRIKILDFGLAKQAAPGALDTEGLTASSPTEAGVVMGTVAYMSPEQMQGRPVDARSDLFSLGVVLYELLAKKHPFRRETGAGTVGAILQETPPTLTSVDPSIPRALDGIVRRCLEKEREERFQGAHDLGLALEAVLAAPTGSALLDEVEERSPYPGMASFTERDASLFFGRENDVKALWDRIRTRPLLAVIGPSGAGKSSFLRAGVMASRPGGWAVACATPGASPAVGLARGLTPELAGDATAIGELLGGVGELTNTGETSLMVSAVRKWRAAHAEALLIVDQFEELFTLSAPETQRRFAVLLERLVREAGVHVVLSMRDDFLIRCHEQPALGRVFEQLTPLLAVSGDGLRRALVEPAKKRGFRFEDDALVDEMVKAVEGERGALPLLAFAVSRLWEKRDREKKLLTREAYEEIGGVAGALAQHAEATLDRVGVDRQNLVREIFRNLTTAQQTRCVLDAEELLSVFPEPQRPDAREVLGQLVDARLITSFEVESSGGTPRHRVEIVHESLLTSWPRLVRWQTQDADAALLRDQLRQAAHLWGEKGKPVDLLWTGTSYSEYQIWRERYPGGLSEAEEAFGSAMTERTRRQRRRRRTAYAVILAAVVVVAAGLGTMWRRSARETRRAEAEAGQRGAAQLLALGRLKLADNPNAALAYSIASLERSDNDAARRFAVEALWQGPQALFLAAPGRPAAIRWSPDGRRIVLSSTDGIASLENGSNEQRKISQSMELLVGFSRDGRRFVTLDEKAAPKTLVHVWAVPEGRLERTLEISKGMWFWSPGLFEDHLLKIESDPTKPWGEKRPALVSLLPLDSTAEKVLGRLPFHGPAEWDFDPSDWSVVFWQRGRISQKRLDAPSASARLIGTHEGKSVVLNVDPSWPGRAVSSDDRGEVRIWDLRYARLERTLKSPVDARGVTVDPKGRFLATLAYSGAVRRSLFLFDLTAPLTAEPVPLLGAEEPGARGSWFSPDGAWLATVHSANVIFWNMAGPRSTVVGRQSGVDVAFTPDGHLLSTSSDGVLRLWPLSPAPGDSVRELWSRPGAPMSILAVDPKGRFVVVVVRAGPEIIVVPLDGSRPTIHKLKRPEGAMLLIRGSSLDAEGRSLAISIHAPRQPDLTSIRILDLATGDERTLDTHPKGEERCQKAGSALEGFAEPVWLRDGHLVTDGDAGLRVWDLATGTNQLLRPCKTTNCGCTELYATPDSRSVLRFDPADRQFQASSLSVFDLASRETRQIVSHGNRLVSFDVNASGTNLVTGDVNGVIRVGPLTDEEPHLLFSQTGQGGAAFSPDGRWIVSGHEDGTIRLWPTPDLSRPPLHTLPHDELLAKLRSLTNLRAVRDAASDTGWKIEVGPFPGWKDVPTWQP